MILYNITFNIDRAINDEWLAWLREYYLPAVLSTGYFADHKVYRLLKAEEDDSINYALQFFTDSIEKLNGFLEHDAPEISRQVQEKFRNRHVAFMTVLQDTGL